MFTKKDIQLNYLVKTRAGKIGIVVNDSSTADYSIVFQSGGSVNLDEYYEQLTHCVAARFDIIEVKEPIGAPAFNLYNSFPTVFIRHIDPTIEVNVGDIIVADGHRHIIAKSGNNSVGIVPLSEAAIVANIPLLSFNCKTIQEIYTPETIYDYFKSPKDTALYKYNNANDSYIYKLKESKVR